MIRDKFKLQDMRIDLFRDLDPHILQKWEDIAVSYHLKAGEKLYSQGELATAFYIILQGGVRLVEYTPGGKAVTIKVYGKRDFFGLLALTREHKHAATVEAVGDTRIIAFRAGEARQLLTEHGIVAVRLLDCMTTHVHHSHDRIRHLAAEKTEKRLARALLHFHRKFGYVEGQRYVIDAELSQRDISEFTGTTIETVNRYLRTWEKSGWIELSYKHIDILDPHALEDIAAAASQHGYMPE